MSAAAQHPVRLVTTPGGRIFVNENDRGSVARQLLAGGKYEKDWTKWMRRTVTRGQRALDIGANVGYYTALLSTLVGPDGLVIACEPDPGNAELLRRTVAENAFTQAHVVEAAVSDGVGQAELFQDEAWHGVHSLASNNRVNAGPRSVQVTTVTIDALMIDAGAFDFVKIDAQGAEGRILRAATQLLNQPHATILLEVWPAGLAMFGDTLADVTGPFRQYGFSSFVLNANWDLVTVGAHDIEQDAAAMTSWSSFNLVWRK
jgi:FkbM family methyltransferase